MTGPVTLGAGLVRFGRARMAGRHQRLVRLHLL